VIARTAFNCAEIPNLCINSFRNNTMEIRPMVALRAALVGGVAAFAKITGAMKAAGSVREGWCRGCSRDSCSDGSRIWKRHG
jgi:hypothetical protein